MTVRCICGFQNDWREKQICHDACNRVVRPVSGFESGAIVSGRRVSDPVWYSYSISEGEDLEAWMDQPATAAVARVNDISVLKHPMISSRLMDPVTSLLPDITRLRTGRVCPTTAPAQ